MKGLKLWRTFQEGARNYTRNGWLTVATVVVMTLSLFIVSMTMILGVTTGLILDSLRDKINISVSFNPEVPEESILSIKQSLEKYKEVAAVKYISRDQALSDFISMGGNDPVITQALEEIGENPLLASLNIKAHSPEQYDIIAQALNQSAFKEDISRINYEKNRTAIERLDNINKMTRKVGLVLGIVFISISFLITFNTIRINMHSRRNEFEIMRLVGASNTYVRMPSVFEGIFYGVTAALVTIALVFVSIRLMTPLTEGVIADGTLFQYYSSHFFKIALSITGLGILLGILGGFVAVRKYLKV
ncbi:MAG: permease-like cell division protein FtsX [Candidatus Moranbacteria bacterium]|nr:permease-like cell division protein FtsX [Candidatus Moranbacteria bacterium]